MSSNYLSQNITRSCARRRRDAWLVSHLAAQCVFGRVRDVQEAVVVLVAVVDLTHRRARLRRGVVHEQVDRLIGGDLRLRGSTLVDVLVDDVPKRFGLHSP